MANPPIMVILMAVIAILQAVVGYLEGNFDQATLATVISAVGGIAAVFHHTKQVNTALMTPPPVDLPQPSDSELGD